MNNFYLLIVALLQIGITSSTAAKKTSIEKTEYLDRDKLGKLIGNARVVMLGDGTHGEGSVMKANIETIKYLHENMGFNTIAFESGIYDLYKAQTEINLGSSVNNCIRKSIFPIWTNTCEFQELIKYIDENRLEIKLIGFDCQLTGDYSTYESIDDLQELFEYHHISTNINFEFVEEVFINIGEDLSFPFDSIGFNQFTNEMDHIAKHLLELKQKKIVTVDLWLQFINSTKNLAIDYYKNNPNAYSEENWKASQNNPRDAQMAKNLLFHLNKYPNDKIVCWGASAHFAKDFSMVENEELKTFKSMGSHLKEQLDSNLFVLAPITSSGSYGPFFKTKKDTISNISKNSIEFELSQKNSFYQLIDLHKEKRSTTFTSYAIDYSPLQAAWNELFDAFIFIKSVTPPTIVSDECRYKGNNKVKTNDKIIKHIKGKVIDENNKAIPYCNVLIKNSLIGAMSNRDGDFQITTSKESKLDTLYFSCVGYHTQECLVKELGDSVKLISKDILLNEVEITAKSLNPRDIIKKAILQIPKNYFQEDYNLEFYSRGKLTNFDTIKIDLESVGIAYDQAAFDSNKNTLVTPKARKVNISNFKHATASYSTAAKPNCLRQINFVGSSPLLKKRNIKKYEFELLGTTTFKNNKVYKIAFKCKHPSHHYSGWWDLEKYDGSIYINTVDYSIVRVVEHGKFKRDKLKIVMDQTTFIGESESIYSSSNYGKHPNGKYFIESGEHYREQKGQIDNQYYELKGQQTFFTTNIALDSVTIIKPKSYISFNKKKFKQSDDFWRNYRKMISND